MSWLGVFVKIVLIHSGLSGKLKSPMQNLMMLEKRQEYTPMTLASGISNIVCQEIIIDHSLLKSLKNIIVKLGVLPQSRPHMLCTFFGFEMEIIIPTMVENEVYICNYIHICVYK